jgi:hypothetical protein
VRTPAETAEPAEWLSERLLVSWSRPDRGSPVGSCVATGFEAYARVFPSLSVSEEKRLSWAELAAINGRVAHPLMELHLIASAAPGREPSPWDGDIGGVLPEAELRELAEVLRPFTRTPNRCWYSVWSGYGGIEETETGAKFSTPSGEREYILSFGPIEDATSFEFGTGPDIWWPDDRAWCVGGDTDLAATYVGGSATCIEALLNSPGLEALPVSVSDRVDIYADLINDAAVY